MTKVEINGKKYELAESFDELTLEQYCKAFHGLEQPSEEDGEEETILKMVRNQSKLISRLLGEDDDFCMNLPTVVYNSLYKHISYIYEVDKFLKESRAGITLNGKRYGIPSFEEMPLRQYIDADMTIKDNDSPTLYIELLSILLSERTENGWKPYDGKYEDRREELRNVKCSEALPFVFHFFKKGEALRKLSQAFMKVEESRQHLSTQSS